MEAALERLPEEQRLAVALVLVEGLAYKKRPQYSKCPMGTVTSRLARVRAKRWKRCSAGVKEA